LLLQTDILYINSVNTREILVVGTVVPELGMYKNVILLFSLALQPSAGYGFLVHEVS
jgi:hypothetical protein